MRLKTLWSALLCVIPIIAPAAHLNGQVAPAARVGGIPITVGVGFSRYYLDYGPDRYMEGPVAWASVNVFRGIGLDASARTIFIDTPPALTRMQQSTFLGGVNYEAHSFHLVQPFVRFGAGVGVIEFPSHNPLYTRDSYFVMAPSAGVDVHVSQHVALRGQYEYQFWKDYLGPRYLNPQGFTIGVSYSFAQHRVRRR